MSDSGREMPSERTPTRQELIERLSIAEAQLAEAKAGWDSCIADLREAAEICRETEAQLAAANECIAELERIIASIKLADDEKADSLNSYRVDLETAIEQRDEARKEVERLSTPVTDEEMDLFALHVIHVVQPDRTLPVLTIDRATALLATRAQKGSPK